MKYLYILFNLLFFLTASAQDSDAVNQMVPLPEINIKAYFIDAPLLQATGSVSVLDSAQLQRHAQQSLVSAVNTISGVRMEERSPGSYRFSIRGSLLRSPFGVRNVKIYLDDFCLTDAGGNTYINLLDAASISRLEILKGPEGSIYGANTGGVVLIRPIIQPHDSLYFNSMTEAGSYGYFKQKLQFQKIIKNYSVNITASYQRANGYRKNSKSDQWTVQAYQQWQYTKKASLKVYALFSKLRYQTPGGLNKAQFDADPSAARPATPTLPSAETQQAGIFNTTVFVGVSNEVNISERWQHVIAIAGSHTEFKNPFITNYEQRSEDNVDIRTYFLWKSKKQKQVQWNWVNGIELQQNFSRIQVYGNNKGMRDTMQSSYRFHVGQYFYFSRFSMNINKRITIEGSMSFNYNGYNYKSIFPAEDEKYTKIKFRLQMMPRIAMSVKMIESIAWRASVSRGYSPPTLAEIHPSASLIIQNLQPEQGWNYETGFRFRERHDRVRLDAVIFYYRLQNAIVARSDSAGNSYFVNAGGTHQLGIETQLFLWAIKPKEKGFVRNLQFNISYTFNHFLFRNYSIGDKDYSGNHLTGVPPNIVVVNANMEMPLGFYFFTEYSFTSHLPLNDANNAWARYYHLLQFKGGWQKQFKKFNVELYAGINNAINQKYSLGNDINAAANRYYNAAAPINFYGGVKFGWVR